VIVSRVSNDAADQQRWDAFVSRSPDATLYHRCVWKRVIEETFSHRTFYLCALSGPEDVAGVLPLAQLNSRLFGNALVSLPFFNYSGICASSREARQLLLDGAVGVAREAHADYLEIRHEDPQWHEEDPAASTSSKVAMRLELPPTPEALWTSFPSKLRSQVQRARKEAMTAVVGRVDQLDPFYAVFSANMRDLGTPVYPRTFFRNILELVSGETWIAVVYHRDRPVAAGFLAGFRGRLEIPWASSLREFNRLGPNMLLYWTCLELACRQGYRVFDFGRSTPGAGTYRFKEQWGASPVQLYRYYWLNRGVKLPQTNPDNPKYRAAIAVWQKLPLAVTERLGPKIVKYIP
jgi:FemAB-related protein (PEP-CTERM system-associated)